MNSKLRLNARVDCHVSARLAEVDRAEGRAEIANGQRRLPDARFAHDATRWRLRLRQRRQVGDHSRRAKLQRALNKRVRPAMRQQAADSGGNGCGQCSDVGSPHAPHRRLAEGAVAVRQAVDGGDDRVPERQGHEQDRQVQGIRWSTPPCAACRAEYRSGLPARHRRRDGVAGAAAALPPAANCSASPGGSDEMNHRLRPSSWTMILSRLS